MIHRLPKEFNTPRLLLRSPIAADAAEIFHAYAQDLQVCRFMVWAPHTCAVQTEEFIASCIKAWSTASRLPYVIAEQGSNLAVGMLEARMQGTTVDIGYVLARTKWGMGLMPEAIQSFTAIALGQPGIFRVQASCDIENIPSQRALEKSGFAREGRLERYNIHPNISYEPRACFMYAKCS